MINRMTARGSDNPFAPPQQQVPIRRCVALSRVVASASIASLLLGALIAGALVWSVRDNYLRINDNLYGILPMPPGWVQWCAVYSTPFLTLLALVLLPLIASRVYKWLWGLLVPLYALCAGLSYLCVIVLAD